MFRLHELHFPLQPGLKCEGHGSLASL